MNSAARFRSAAALALCCFIPPAQAGPTQQCLQYYYSHAYAKALPYCIASADGGDSQSQYVLGLMYSEGLGVKRNNAEAVKWLRRAAEHSYAAAHYKLNRLEQQPAPDPAVQRILKAGRAARSTTPAPIPSPMAPRAVARPALPANIPTALQAPPTTDPGGDPTAAATAAPARPTAPTGTVTTERSTLQTTAQDEPIQLPRPADSTADPAADTQLASLPTPAIRPEPIGKQAGRNAKHHAAATDSPPVDPKAEFQRHLVAAKQGNVDARFQLGLDYLHGRGIERSESRAGAQFKQAARERHADAAYYLGMMYYHGRGGLFRNHKRAITWLTRAAGRGVADAQYALGLIHANGDGVKQDQAAALRWWQMAAKQRHPQALHNLAVMYLKGISAPPDRDRALRLFIAEAEQGDAQAQFNLGRLYSEGKWFETSISDAAHWFYLAGEQWLAAGRRDRAEQALSSLRRLTDATEQQVAPELAARLSERISRLNRR